MWKAIYKQLQMAVATDVTLDMKSRQVPDSPPSG